MKKNEANQIMVLGAAVVLAYIPTLMWMYDRWVEHDTYYSHGFLVPLICGFLIWQRRKQLVGISIAPSSIGWWLFIPGILIHFVSALLRVYFTSGFSLFLVLPGLILLSMGPRWLKALWFPLAFLVFMVPLPLVAIANISFRLKLFAAGVATNILHAIGLAAVREGSVIQTAHSYLIVEDPCSGIRSLIALFALGTLMAYYSELSRWKKIVVFLCAGPIAVLSNIFRITCLCVISEMYGSKYATGIVHDTLGILVFVVAFIGMLFIAKLLEG